MVAIQFSWLVALQKAAMKTLGPILILGLTFLVENPAILDKLLGNVGKLTVAAGVLFLIQLFLNWLKNKDLGK